jgi:hypothetical protein
MRRSTGSTGGDRVARARLTLFFVAIVVLPVAVATAYGWSAVARTSERQIRSELDLSRRSAMLVLAAQLEQAADAVRSVARDPALQRALVARDRARLQAVLDASAPPTCCWP